MTAEESASNDAALCTLEKELNEAGELARSALATFERAHDRLPEWCRGAVGVQVATYRREPDGQPEPVIAYTEEQIHESRGFSRDDPHSAKKYAEWCQTMTDKLHAKRVAVEQEHEQIGLATLSEHSDLMQDRVQEIENRIKTMPAHTAKGIAIKLRLGLRILGYDSDDKGEPSWAAELLMSVVDDLEGLAVKSDSDE